MNAYEAAGGHVEGPEHGPPLDEPVLDCPRDNWVELRYYHCDGAPAPGARYIIETEGFSAAGVLDDDGFVHIDSVPDQVTSFEFVFEDDPEAYVPQPPSASTATPASHNALLATFEEAWDWLWGTIQGDFNQDATISQTAVNAIIGLIPIADQVLDVRDMIAGIKHLIVYYMETTEEQEAHPDSLGLSYETWLWLGLFLIAIGCIPTVGSAVKGVFKTIIRALQDAGRAAGGLSARQLRAIWEWLIRVLNGLGIRPGNAHRWLRELPNQLGRYMDDAAAYIRDAANTFRRFLDDVAVYMRRLDQLPYVDHDWVRRTLTTIERSKRAIDEMLSNLERQKRIINEWLGEQLNRVLDAKGSSRGTGSVNTHPSGTGSGDAPPTSSSNQVVQEAEPPPEVRLGRPLASREHAARVLRESEDREIRRLEEDSNRGRGRYGPAHATVVDRGNLGPDGKPRVFSGRNVGNRFNPDNLHPTLKRRYDAYLRAEEAMGQRRTFGNGTPVDGNPGHHAEIQAVNDALKARPAAGLPDDDAALEELLASVRRVEVKSGQSGKQFGCCNDCRRILTREGGPTSVDFTEPQRVQNALPEGER